MRPILILPLLALAAPATAAVTETRPSGFTITYEAVVDSSAEEMYERFGKPGLWWNPDHTWWGKAENLTMDLKAGGCFCERAKGAGEVEHLRVIFVQPGRMVRLSGGLGPISQMAATGIMTVKFADQNGEARVTLIYDVEGHLMRPADQLAPIVDKVLADQFARLTALK